MLVLNYQVFYEVIKIVKRNIPGLIIIAFQIIFVGLFFTTVFSDKVKVEKYVSTVHNENLNKIATSVSVLFEEEEKNVDTTTVEEELVVEELPSIEEKVVVEEKVEPVVEVKEEEIKTEPLVSVDASKYVNNEPMGFKVTEGNKQYSLNDYEFNVVVAVVAGEFDKNKDDALAVVSVILNRCDSDKWSSWAGSTPYSQVTRKGQFEVYGAGYYLAYMPDGSKYGSEKYNTAKQAVIDGLNGIRNNSYLGFRAWHISSYSDKYMVSGGNRYGYN